MMLDRNIVAVSPSSTYRVLSEADLLARWKNKVSKKGTGFEQPLAPHDHWHIDVSYIYICGTFYYLCGILVPHLESYPTMVLNLLPRILKNLFESRV